jgi:hypothetical protein
MQFGSSLDSFPCFTRLNPCVAHCPTDSIPWVHYSREEGSLDYDGGFVRLQIHINFDTIIYRQHHLFRAELHTLPTPDPWVRRAVRAGGMSISLRESRRELYIPCTMTSNNAEWERGWFYLRNDEPSLPTTPARS